MLDGIDVTLVVSGLWGILPVSFDPPHTPRTPWKASRAPTCLSPILNGRSRKVNCNLAAAEVGERPHETGGKKAIKEKAEAENRRGAASESSN